jgi:opacity protein-like surface antigen
MRKLLILPLFIFLLTPFVTYSQSSSGEATSNSYSQSRSSEAAIQNTIGFGPRLGYYKANDADEGNFYGGLQTRLRFGPVFGLEGSVEYRAGQEYSVAGQSVKTKFVPVTASALMFLPVSENFAPYGIAGLGAYYTIFDYDGPVSDESDNEFNMGYHLGFGIELPISSKSALNFDYRYLFLNPDDNEENLEGASHSGNVFTVGLMFYL